MSYINSVSASSPTYSVNRKSDTKSGIIELNKIKIRVNEGDNLQRICNKINSKTSLHGVTAKLARERGHTVISLSSPRQIDILDRNNILNNIGMRIRANLARNSLVDGLILTFLAEHKKASPRYIVSPYQICEAPINNLPAVSAIREEVNELEGLAELFNEIEEEIVFEREQVIVKEKPSCPLEVLRKPKVLEPISAIQEDLSEENISSDEEIDKENIYNMARIVFDPFLNQSQKMNLAKSLVKSRIPVQGESSLKNKTHAVERVKEDSLARYKSLSTMAEKKLFFNQAKDFLREKAISVQGDKNPKYSVEQINRAKVDEVLYWYDKSSPLKNREDRWI